MKNFKFGGFLLAAFLLAWVLIIKNIIKPRRKKE